MLSRPEKSSVLIFLLTDRFSYLPCSAPCPPPTSCDDTYTGGRLISTTDSYLQDCIKVAASIPSLLYQTKSLA